VKHRLLIIIGAIFCTIHIATAENLTNSIPELSPDLDEDVTVITSDRLTFDYNKKFALFEKNVTVVDPEMRLTSDIMLVRFDNDDQVSSIVAKRAVRIEQDKLIAESGMATYDVKPAIIKLEISPRVMRGKNILEGDIITFWRNEDKMLCEPQARLIIYPDEKDSKLQLFGE
jgi:lipopolysaccharide transport protein LptA